LSEEPWHAINPSSHRKFAIRPTPVRRTSVGQTATRQIGDIDCTPSHQLHKYASFFWPGLRRVTPGAARRTPLVFERFTPRAAIGTSIAFIIASQRRLRFAGLF
jgi:hypothetical protein